MNRRKLLEIPLLLAMALCAKVAQAQPESRIPVRVMALSESGLPEVYVKAGADYKPLEFSSVQPSPAVSSSFANPLPIYQRRSNAAGKDEFTVMTQVTLPPDSKGVLLLGWGSPEKASYLAIADDFANAGSADWMVINATGKQLAMQLGKNTKFVRVPPSGAAPFRVMAELNRGASVQIAEPLGAERWKTFYSTYWPIYPDRRCLVLFVNIGDQIKVKKISDIKPPPESASN